MVCHRPPQGDRSERYFHFLYTKINVEVQDLFEKARGPRGVIFPKYEPVASHGDPKSARNPEIRHFVNLSGHAKSDFLDIVCIENRDLCVANTKT